MSVVYYVLFGVLAMFSVVGGTVVYHGLRYRLPYAPSSRRSIEHMLSFVDSLESKTVLDLGSGTGDVLLRVAKRGGRAIGIEVNLFLVWITRVRAWYAGVSDRVTIIRRDVFQGPLPQADVVILYVVPGFAARLAPKLRAELSVHAYVISHACALPGWAAYKDSGEVQVYRMVDQVH